MTVLFRTGAAVNHNGGHIAFGPRGLLYAVVGENGSPSNAQDLGTTLGEFVRMTANGDAPASNPSAAPSGPTGSGTRSASRSTR